MCFSVSLIWFTSCAAMAPESNRARARSAENNAPRNPRRVDTAYPFRMSDMVWSSSRHIACTPQFWPRHDGNRTDVDAATTFTPMLCDYLLLAWLILANSISCPG